MINKFVSVALAYLGAMASLVGLWRGFDIKSPEIVWAFTTTTVFLAIYLLGMVCNYKLAVYQTRIDQCAEAKRKLESQILKKRRSSKRK